MEDKHRGFPVHQHLLVEKGVYIIENMKLGEPCVDGVYEFPFILLPTRYPARLHVMQGFMKTLLRSMKVVSERKELRH